MPETLIAERPGGADSPAAFLLDVMWPEYDRYLEAKRSTGDYFFLPLPARGRLSGPRFAWSSSEGGRVRVSLFTGVHRALTLRRLPKQGGLLQRTHLAFDEKLALRYGRRLPNRCRHVVLTQNLLPFAWRHGLLEGRSFEVLMYRMPMTELQARLDAAFERYPQSTTLNDFRADPRIPEEEEAALAAADRIVTPHPEVAALFAERVAKLDWVLPPKRPRSVPGKRLLFPAPALGRKGAFEVRRLVRELDLPLVTFDRKLEGDDFWQDLPVEVTGPDPFADVGLVLLPSYLEHQPRLLLEASARGIPVVATRASGLAGLRGVAIVPTGDFDALRRAVEAELGLVPGAVPDTVEGAVSGG